MDNKEIKVTIMGIIIVAVLMFFAGKTYESSNRNEAALKASVCTPGKLCPNSLEAIKRLRDYQLDLHNDTVRIWDGDRLVGSYISNWGNQMDSIILKDNE